jgi:hypothetical protein
VHIDSLAQEVPQLAPRYSPRLLAWHIKQLLSRLAIVVWKSQVIVPIERVAAYVVESFVHGGRDAFGDIAAAPVQGHSPFPRPDSIRPGVLAFEDRGLDSILRIRDWPASMRRTISWQEDLHSTCFSP